MYCTKDIFRNFELKSDTDTEVKRKKNPETFLKTKTDHIGSLRGRHVFAQQSIVWHFPPTGTIIPPFHSLLTRLMMQLSTLTAQHTLDLLSSSAVRKEHLQDIINEKKLYQENLWDRWVSSNMLNNFRLFCTNFII